MCMTKSTGTEILKLKLFVQNQKLRNEFWSSIDAPTYNKKEPEIQDASTSLHQYDQYNSDLS